MGEKKPASANGDYKERRLAGRKGKIGGRVYHESGTSSRWVIRGGTRPEGEKTDKDRGPVRPRWFAATPSQERHTSLGPERPLWALQGQELGETSTVGEQPPDSGGRNQTGKPAREEKK